MTTRLLEIGDGREGSRKPTHWKSPAFPSFQTNCLPSLGPWSCVSECPRTSAGSDL